MRNSLEPTKRIAPGHGARTMGRAALVALGAAVLAVGSAGAASAEAPIGSTYFWPDERVDQYVAMDDPWVFRGPTNYKVTTQPSCWSYSDRQQELVAEIGVSAPDRFEPYPFDSDRLFFPVNETVTVDWTNTTTGDRGQVVSHGNSGSVLIGIPGGDGRIEMDIHLRSDQPWLAAAGSTDLPFGHSEGATAAAVDLAGKTCAPPV